MRGLDGVPPCRACLDAGVSAPCCASTTIEEKGREAMLSHANLVRHTLSPQSKRRDERRTSRPGCGPTASAASPLASGHLVRSPPRGSILRTLTVARSRMHAHAQPPRALPLVFTAPRPHASTRSQPAPHRDAPLAQRPLLRRRGCLAHEPSCGRVRQRRMRSGKAGRRRPRS